MAKYGGGKFRKKKYSFSMVSNHAIRNESLSLRAKGLYSLIQSYVTIDGFVLYKGFLQAKCVEGSRAFDSAWKELKDRGYLIQYKLKDENNRYCYEYDLLDEPYPQNVGVENFDKSHPHFAGVQSEDVQIESVQSVGLYNNTLMNNIISNNTLSNQIISERDVMDQIGYDKSLHDDFAENLVLLMTDVLNTPDDSLIRVNQTSQKAKVVKERFRQIRYKHIEYVKLVFLEYTGEISSIRSYLITALFNSLTTCDIYFSQRVQHDLYGEGEKKWQIVK